MAARELPPVDLLRKLLSYDPETGVLTWRERNPEMFDTPKPHAVAQRWNKNFAGRRAGSGRSYVRVRIGNNHYLAHRIAWAIHYGTPPTCDIDHINHIGTDNRITNLREVVNSENWQNCSMRKDNVSGVVGVCFHPRWGTWQAQISVNGKRMHLGAFSDFADAVAVRKAAEREHGFHPNHGKARHVR